MSDTSKQQVQVRIRYKFAPVPRELAQDPNITANTLAVITYLCSKGDDWTPRVYDIKKRFKFSERAWRGVSSEMRKLNILALKRAGKGTDLFFDPNGIEDFARHVHSVTVTPMTRQLCTPLEEIDPTSERDLLKKIDLYEHSSNALCEEDKSLKEIHRPATPPTPKQADEAFERLWDYWPNKKGRQNAHKAFLKFIKENPDKPLENIAKEVWCGLVGYLQEYRWRCEAKEQDSLNIFIPSHPHGSTWFAQRRWQDNYILDSNELLESLHREHKTRSKK